ncbi:MAG: AbrB/MazE/SpoVT family DNA-binding domain-containing protein [Microbacteriaceae bacterium]|nr:AbrB/MazE/SpoVT family DNA-binding domain-containing protein [Microbacteriaceae bacterium]
MVCVARNRNRHSSGLLYDRIETGHRPLRQHRGWPEGTTLVAIETAAGVVVTSREELELIVEQQLAGVDLVAQLLEERRASAALDDRA